MKDFSQTTESWTTNDHRKKMTRKNFYKMENNCRVMQNGPKEAEPPKIHKWSTKTWDINTQNDCGWWLFCSCYPSVLRPPVNKNLSTFLQQPVLFTVVNHLYLLLYLLDIVYLFLVFLMSSVKLLMEACVYFFCRSTNCFTCRWQLITWCHLVTQTSAWGNRTCPSV